MFNPLGGADVVGILSKRVLVDGQQLVKVALLFVVQLCRTPMVEFLDVWWKRGVWRLLQLVDIGKIVVDLLLNGFNDTYLFSSTRGCRLLFGVLLGR